MSQRTEQFIHLPPASVRGQSLTLDLPRESRRSFILRRDGSRDEAGAGYELTPGELDVELEGQGRIGAALRMNATTIWFEPAPRTHVPYGQSGRVTLRTAEGTFGPFDTMIGIEALSDDVHAVARLRDVPLPQGRELVSFMLRSAERGRATPIRPRAAVQTDITDPARIRAVLHALAHRMATAVIQWGGEAIAASLTQFDEARGTLYWSLTTPPLGRSFEGEVSIEVAGYNCVYQMHVPRVTRAGDGLVASLPDRIDYNRYRRYRRAPISDTTVVRFEHPLWREIPPFDRTLLDVSFGGIAFVADPVKDALYVGLRVEVIEIASTTADPILLRGTVRSLVGLPDGTTTCGMSVEPRSPECAEEWATFVMQALNRTTAPIGDRVEQLWDLYTDSGYFNLSGKDPHEFDSLALSFRQVVERTRSVPWLSYQAVWPSGHRIDAAASIVKVYQGTWMFHQLAKRRGGDGEKAGRHILRDTYLRAFEYIQSDANCNWVLVYGEAHVRWMQRSHYAFAEHFESTGAAIARPFNLMEANCRLRAEATPLNDYRVGAAAPDERQLIVDVLGRTLPQPYIEACDLVGQRFDISVTKRVWSEIGLEREREVWVARHRNEPVAAAIMEAGQTGTNLFRLLDSVRLIELAPRGEDAFLPLLEKAKAWFLARGKSSFVYLREHPNTHHVEVSHLRDLGEGRVWVIRADLIPDFLELVCELTSQTSQPQPGRSESAVPGPISVRGEFMLRQG